MQPGRTTLSSRRYANCKAQADRETAMMIITEVQQEFRRAYALKVNYASEPGAD